MIASSEWKQAFALYNWPLYSALIAGIHKLTSLDIQTTAQVLNILFFAITTFSFLSLVRMAGGDKTTIVSAALLLFSSDYIVGHILPMLLRDQGFWAFFLTSLVYFIRFYREGKLSDALIWQILAIIAVLFRIEAITYLILLPFIILKNDVLIKSERILRITQASAITLIVFFMLLAVVVLSPSIKLADLGRIQEAVNLGQGQVVQSLMAKADMMGQAVLGSELSDYAMVGLILTLVGILLVKTAEAAGWLCIGLLCLTYKSTTKRPNQDVRIILYWVAVLALLNMSMIMLRTYVLSGRYVIALGLIVMIFASFGLASFLEPRAQEDKKTHAKNWVLIIIVIFLSFSLLRNLAPKKEGYNYQQDAVAWIKNHTSKNSTVFYDSPRLRYYAGLPLIERGVGPWDVVTRAINDNSINQYDYLVVHISRKNPEREIYLTKILNRQKVMEFVADDGARILILSNRKL